MLYYNLLSYKYSSNFYFKGYIIFSNYKIYVKLINNFIHLNNFYLKSLVNIREFGFFQKLNFYHLSLHFLLYIILQQCHENYLVLLSIN